MSHNMGGLKSEWLALKTIRAEKIREAHRMAEAETAQRRAAFAARVADLVRRGARKSEICREAMISRSTLDALLKEAGASRGVSSYWFEVGYGTNVTLIGQLPDTGGFPRLEGDVKIRFRIHDGIATADDFGFTPEAEFLNATYGAEAFEFAVAEKVPGWDSQPVQPGGDDTW